LPETEVIVRNRGVALLLCVLVAPIAAQDLPPAPGRLVDVGGRRLHLLCSGQGSPVILEAGASSFAIDWTLVQHEVDRTNRVCSYDRAGMGWSDSAAVLGQEVPDLHRLLAAAGERPPYVMVGASRGGLLVRAYTLAHGSDVLGLVLVDPATEDRLFTMLNGQAVLLASLTPEQLALTVPTRPIRVPRRPAQTGAPFNRLPAELQAVRIKLEERLIASIPESVTPDLIALAQQADHALLSHLMATRSSEHPLGNRPLVVLSRGDERNAGREESHMAVARLSSNSRFTVVAGAGHEIHLYEPAAVVQAIADVLRSGRDRTPLAR
jgi:pimeloyl-ACP methyl ester carboxylesterase